jgi:hypothetical protein
VGYNSDGELGNNSSANSPVPVQVSGLTGVVGVAAGSDNSLEVKSDGSVWAWGYSETSEFIKLSGNSTLNSPVPVQVSGLAGVVSVAAGYDHSLAVEADGSAWVWGYNVYGAFGNNITVNGNSSPVAVPVPVSGLSGVVGVAAVYFDSFAVKADGSVGAWGYNIDGQMGNNSTTNSLVPGQVVGPNGVGFLNLGTGATVPILWRNDNGDVALWFMSGGTINSSADLGVIPSTWTIQGTADFNSDGKSDILWRNANGDVVIWFMNGSTIASSADLGVIPADWTIQGTGDFDANGTTDILWRNSNGDVVVWYMNAGFIEASADLGVISSDWTIQGTGDFDGDGKTDILWRNANGDVVVWFMNGGRIASSADLGVIPSDWSIQRTGDFDADGKSDILWRNANGDVVVWFMSGGTIASSVDLGVVPSSWTIQGTGDFNGDGKADILWRNANGDVVTWLMNGGAIASSTDLGVIPTSWAINGVGH